MDSTNNIECDNNKNIDSSLNQCKSNEVIGDTAYNTNDNASINTNSLNKLAEKIKKEILVLKVAL